MKTKHALRSLILGLVFSLPFSVTATVHVLDFDYNAKGKKIGNGRVIDKEYKDFGVTISSCNYHKTTNDVSIIDDCDDGDGWEQTQITYKTNRNNSDGPDTDLEFEKQNGQWFSKDAGQVYNTTGLPDSFANRTHPRNVLILNEYENTAANTKNGNGNQFKDGKVNDQGSRAAGYFDFSFDTAITLNSIDFFDIEDLTPNMNSAFYALQLFDENGTEISPGLEVPFLNNGEWTRIFYNIAGIYSIRINMPGSGAIDNLAFTKEVSAPAGIAILLLAGWFVGSRRRN